MTEEFTLVRYSQSRCDDEYPTIRKVYQEVYADPPYNRTEDDVKAFDERFALQSAGDDFRFIAAQVSGRIVGYTYTVTFGQGKWWIGAQETPPDEIVDAEKVAVIELIVRQEYRGMGIGKALMNEALTGRSEPCAILLTNPKAAALEIYQRWGWKDIGGVQAQPGWPVSRSLIFELTQ